MSLNSCFHLCLILLWCTLQIAEFELVEGKVKARLHSEVLERSLQDVGSHPLLVVSISGVFRSGKSFLLNLMLSYLNSMSKVRLLRILRIGSGRGVFMLQMSTLLLRVPC